MVGYMWKPVGPELISTIPRAGQHILMNKVCLCAGSLKDYWMDFNKVWWEDGERAKKKNHSNADPDKGAVSLLKASWVIIFPREEIQTRRGLSIGERGII